MREIPDRALRQKLAPHRRRAWLPEVVEGEGGPDASRFSGRPSLQAGEPWPPCGNCGRPMQLFVQLNARDLPEAIAPLLEGKLLQLFYCTSESPHCESECQAFFANARSTLLRLVAYAGLDTGGAVQPPEESFPPRRIVGWTETADYPGWDELDELGVPLTDEEADALGELDFPRTGEKLAGWPAWIQGVEYPSCPDCGQPMQMLFQLDSNQNLPYMFGDAGIGHITQCPEHRERLAFGWACF